MSKSKTKRTGGTRNSTDKAPKVTAAKGPTAKAKSKSKRPAVEKKPKRVSALDAAATVLKSAGKPMRAQELITAMAEQGLCTSPKGRTPSATLYAAMQREIAAKGADARFSKVDRGQFEFNAGVK